MGDDYGPITIVFHGSKERRDRIITECLNLQADRIEHGDGLLERDTLRQRCESYAEAIETLMDKQRREKRRTEPTNG